MQSLSSAVQPMFKAQTAQFRGNSSGSSHSLGNGNPRASSGNLRNSSISSNSISSNSIQSNSIIANHTTNIASASPLLRLGLIDFVRSRKQAQHSQAAADLEKFSKECALANGSGLAREMSAAYFDENPNSTIRGAVAFMPCKTGQNPTRTLSYSALLQLLVLERYAREHQEVTPVALVGLESGNRGLSRSSSSYASETLCRFAFRLHRFLESRRTLFSRITPILDTEVLNTSDTLAYSRRRKELDLTDAERARTAIQALGMTTSGTQLKIGASNFASRPEIENARKFANRNQLNLFLGQTVAEDELLRGSMATLYAQGPASLRLAQLAIHGPTIFQASSWMLVDHLTISENEFRQSWNEHEQLDQLYKLISELDPSLSIVDENLAWALDCSTRMMAFHDAQLFEASTQQHGSGMSAQALDSLKRDYVRALRTYLRDLAARNHNWLTSVSNELGFAVQEPSSSIRNSSLQFPTASQTQRLGTPLHQTTTPARRVAA